VYTYAGHGTLRPVETFMLKWLGRGLIALIVGVAAAYPVSDLLRAPLDDAARASLLGEGKAHQFVRTSLGAMHVREAGPLDGPVVLLVHGGVAGGFAFKNWQAPLAEAGYRVIVPDLLGYGFSERPDVAYTRAFYGRQLAELLDGMSVSGPVHVVGASMGGALVTGFAAQSPGRVKSVTLIAPAGGGRTQIVSPYLLWPVVGDWVFRVVGPSSSRDMMARAYAGSPDAAAMDAWMVDQGRFRGYGDGLLNTLRNYDTAWQPEDYAALGRSGLPVLAVWGTADTVNPFAQSKALLARVPQMKLVALEGKPHAITFGEAPLVLAAVIPFLQAADAPR
jgi:pimeloyl-ACP methyl ester carboxylesterase